MSADIRPSSRPIRRTVVAAAIVASTVVAPPASPAAGELPPASTEAGLGPGAYIIDMGVTPQTIANGLKPYGLVYDLAINHQIPVLWVIDSSKAREGVDFSLGDKDYVGGPFIVEAEFAEEAGPIIEAWEAQGVVVDGPTTAPIDVPVYETITAWPNAVLDAKNGGIAAGYYVNAGIPSSNYRIGLPADLTDCDDIYVMPHADPAWGTHQNLVPFNEGGGYIWAACHAVSVLENVANPADPDPDPEMNFLSTDGLIDFGDHDSGSPPYSYSDLGGDPVMQFLGVLDGAQLNGSEQIYLPALGSGWRPSTKVLAWDPDQADVVAGSSHGEAATLAYGRGFGDPTNGFVMFEGGHSHNKGPESDLVAAQRAFFNLHLLSGIERGIEVTVDTPDTIASGATVTVSATITGGSHDYDYEWVSSCGGSFDVPAGSGADPTELTVTTAFTAPSGAQGCSIKLRVSDTCGRDSFGASGAQIVELADLTLAKSDDLDPAEAGATLTYTLVAANPTGPSAAEDVTITDTLPPDVTFVSAAPSQGTCAYLGGGVLSCELGDLAIGATATVDVTARIAGDFEGTLSNTATVDATQADPNPANNTATETTEVGINGLRLAKSADPDFIPASIGSADVTYTFVATNDGTRPVAAVGIVDDQCTPTYVGGDTNVDTLLDPGETWTFTCVVPDVDADVVNVATVSGIDSVLGAVSSPEASASVDVIAPQISITKSPVSQDTPEGGQAVFTITVENTGDIPLTEVVVTDTTAPACDRFYPSLAVGQSVSYRCFVDHGLTAGGTGSNTIGVAALDPSGEPVTADDTAEFTAIDSDLAITKTNAAAGDLYPGDAVEYTIVVENTSGVTQNDVVVTDVLPDGFILDGPTTVEAPTLVSGAVAGDAFDTNGSYAGGSGWVANPPASLLITSATTTTTTTGGTSWSERDDAAAANGQVGVGGGELEITGNSLTTAVGAQQLLDLTGYSAATISFDCDTSGFDNGDDAGYFYVNGTIVERYRDATNTTNPSWVLCEPALTPHTVDLTAYAGQQIAIGFGATGNKSLLVDNISVTGVGGPSPIAGANFDTSNYEGGTGQWAGLGWFEFGEGNAAAQGDLVVTGGALEMTGTGTGGDANWVYRSVDLTDNVTASLSFDCNTTNFNSADDLGFLEVDGATVETYRNGDNTDTANVLCDPVVTGQTFDLTPYVGGVVTLGFGIQGDKTWVVDSIAITGTSFVTDTFTGGTSPNLVTAADDVDLPVGGVMTITVPVRVDAGLSPYVPRPQVNTASAASVEQPVPVSAGSLVNVVVSGVDIVKTADPSIASPGDPVTYTMVVTNTGNIAVDPDVSDPGCAPVTYMGGDTDTDDLLDLTETWTYQCVTTAAPVTNTATVTAVDTNAVAVPPASDSATIDLVVSDIAVSVVTSTPVIRPGEAADYTYEVTTDGASEELAAVSVADDTCSAVIPVLSAGFNVGDTDTDGLLDPTETWEFTCSTPLASTTTNTATASGTDRADEEPTATDSASVTVIEPDIALDKAALQNDTDPGDPVTFRFTVTNPGNDAFGSVAIDDDQCTAVYDSGDTNIDSLLDPGEEWIYLCTTNPTDDVVNYASVTGTDSLGLVWTADDSATVNVVTPSIAVGKIADGTVVYFGDLVSYGYTVFNDGDTPFDVVTAVDDVCLSVVRVADLAGDGDDVLEPDEAWSYSCTQNLETTTTNDFTVTATPQGGGDPVVASTTENVTVLDPSVAVTKVADETLLPVGGGEVTYTYTVTNTSPDTSTFHFITLATPVDDACSPVSYVSGDDGDGQLGFDEATGDPEVWTYSCTTTVTEDTTGTVTVNGTDSQGNPIPKATATEFVDVVPDVSATKTADPTIVPAAGDDVTFTYRVVNDAAESVTVTALADSIYGDLDGQGDCAVPQTIDAGGSYRCSFTTVVSGPAGGSETNVLTVTANDAEGNVVSPTASATVDFGDVVIGDLVWLDLDADGVRDTGEPGRDGVDVDLYTSGGVLVASTTTSGGGLYEFAGQVPGDYFVRFTDPLVSFGPADAGIDDAVDSDVTDLDAGTTDVFTVVAGDTNASVDASVLPASIVSTVWLDLDEDGIQDAGETGIAGVTVELYDSLGGLVATTTTGGDGSYAFDGLQPGGYDVVVVYPAASFSPADAGSDDAVDSDVDAGGAVSVVLTSGDNDVADAGVLPAAIDSTVWLDLDGDDLRTIGEPGVAGVTVELTDGGGTTISTTTDAAGDYSFAGLVPGDYDISIVYPAATFVDPDVGVDDAIDSDVDAGGDVTVTLASGANDPADAGIEPASLTSTVWLDLDGDGIQDTDELGIEGVTVELYDAEGALVGTTTTLTDGSFTFADLPPGDYDVTVVYPGGTFSPQDAGSDDTIDSDVAASGTASVTLLSGANDLADAGLVAGAIESTVWLDVDGDGTRDTGDVGIPGIDVELYDAGGALVATTTTDASGRYSFEGLAPADYDVQIVYPDAGYSPSGSDSDVDASGAATLSLGSTTVVGDGDAGVLPAIVGDSTWIDTDGDGDQSGEPGLVDVVVTATETSTGLVISTTSTIDGAYLLSLAPGTYTIEFTPPGVSGDYEATVADVGSDTTDSDIGAGTNDVGPLAFASGDSVDHVDAGFYEPASLAGTVWDDSDGDRGIDAAEPGLAGVTVRAENLTTGAIFTTDTNASGAYLFAGLPPGDYEISVDPVDLPSGYLSTTANDPESITIASGDTVADVDFGYAEPVTIGGDAWLDLDQDGIQDPAEPGRDGVTVELYTAAGVLAGTTTTSGGGTYSFVGELPGEYYLVFTDPLAPEAGFGDPFQGGDPSLDSDVTDPVAGTTDTRLFLGGTVDDTLDASMVLQPPVANDDGVFVVTEGSVTPYRIDAVGNDTDPEDDIVPASVGTSCPTCTDAVNGTLVNLGDGTFTYVPDPGFTGFETIVYEVCDSTGQCDTATITIDVNDRPDAVDDAAATVENTPVVIPVLDNDADPDGLVASSVTVVSAPANGTTTVDPITGDITYLPDDGFDGVDTFVYQVCDALGACDTATVTVTVDGTPTLVDDSDETLQDTPVVVDVLANDTDVDGIDPTSVTVTGGPANGTTSVDRITGEVTYTPAPGFSGTDEFIYEACDLDGVCASATVTVTVVPTHTVSGAIWLDTDRDGVVDSGDPNIDGVRVVLLAPGPDGRFGTADDVEVAETTTNGSYSFTGVVAGSYVVAIDTGTLPKGLGLTFDVDGGLDEIARVEVGDGDVVGRDFAYAYPALTGTLIGPGDVPAEGARIEFVDAAGNRFSGVAGPGGVYLLESRSGAEFAAGVGTVTVTWPNGLVSSGTVDIVLGQLVVLDLEEDVLPPTGGEPGAPLRIGGMLVLMGATLLLGAHRCRGRRVVAR